MEEARQGIIYGQWGVAASTSSVPKAFIQGNADAQTMVYGAWGKGAEVAEKQAAASHAVVYST